MKKTTFETRQRAEDLLKEAMNIWRQSDQSDYLEGLENDPVFNLLMIAMAYQANEIDAEIERLKGDVIDEYTQAVLPYMAGHAEPANILVSMKLSDNINEVELNSGSVFTIEGTDFKFIPLLKTRAFNSHVQSVVRLDGRRWKVALKFLDNVEDLSGFSFVVKDSGFSNLKIYCGGKQLLISKPWEPANLPFSDAFSLDTMLFNRSQAYDNSVGVMDMFNSHNVCLFTVEEHDPQEYGYAEKGLIELEFEFEGIPVDYPMDKDNLVLNPAILVNASIQETSLSSSAPFSRVGGESCQFLQMMRPSTELVFHNCIVQVRKVAADRFNRSSLVRLLTSLSAKFSSDFYAFQDIHSRNGDKTIQAVNGLVDKMLNVAARDGEGRASGTYLILRQGPVGHKTEVNIDVQYLITDGAAVNPSLEGDVAFSAPLGIDPGSVHLLAPPVPGRDELNVSDYPEMASLYLATNSRIVTPADIRLFCVTELSVRYGLGQNMIKSIRIHREQTDTRDCGYQINVAITLKDNTFVRRSLGQDPVLVASRIEKGLFVRSAGIYPIRLKIILSES
ncbi:MAG: hypothetical protein Q4F39_02100 [Bacteroidia bacterium]|nr:hypothetical protein [Bacteroidia bacterium]